MKQDYTDLTVLVDRSGSMASVRSDMNGGFATFAAEQAKLPGVCLVTMVHFDDHGIETRYIAMPVAGVPALGLDPRGCTPLLDALGKTIASTGARLAALPEPDRPARVLFMVITDGYENASREFKRADIKAMVERQTHDYAWDFMYLGANVDAFAEAGSMGFAQGNTTAYDPSATGVRHAFTAASASTANARSGGTYAITAEDRAQLDADVANGTGIKSTSPITGGPTV